MWRFQSEIVEGIHQGWPLFLNGIWRPMKKSPYGIFGMFFCSCTGVQAKQEESGLSSRTLRLLELEREKYRILSELSGDIVFNYDTKSDVLEFSEKYYDLFHRDIRIPDARDTIERSEVIHPDDRISLSQAFDRADSQVSKLPDRTSHDGA